MFIAGVLDIYSAKCILLIDYHSCRNQKEQDIVDSANTSPSIWTVNNKAN